MFCFGLENCPTRGTSASKKSLKLLLSIKKTIGESLQWILLKKIGEPIIVENKDISTSIIYETLEKVLRE